VAAHVKARAVFHVVQTPAKAAYTEHRGLAISTRRAYACMGEENERTVSPDRESVATLLP
jgi:hypothetical protein